MRVAFRVLCTATGLLVWTTRLAAQTSPMPAVPEEADPLPTRPPDAAGAPAGKFPASREIFDKSVRNILKLLSYIPKFPQPNRELLRRLQGILLRGQGIVLLRPSITSADLCIMISAIAENI